MTATVPPSVAGLWPGASVTRRPGRSPALLVLPSSRSPRMLVPTGVPSAQVMLKRHSTSRTQTAGQEVLAWGVRTGLLPLLPITRLATSEQTPSIDDYVRTHVPTADRIGVLLGPPRANAKPVLQVFAADGTTVGFGKVGHDADAGRLVSREGAVLADPALHDLAEVEVPAVLHAGEWAGLQVLLLSPMRSSQLRRSTWELPVEAIAEVAESAQTSWAAVADSDYWGDLRTRVEQLPAGLGADLVAAVDDLAPLVAGTTLGFGRWHGDWSPWNMGRDQGRLQLWDWEQSRTGVPLGFDAVHFVLQRAFREGKGADEAVHSLLAETPDVLGRWYPSDVGQVEATVLLYLVEIAHRYLFLGGTRPTAQLAGRTAKVRAMTALLSTQRRAR